MTLAPRETGLEALLMLPSKVQTWPSLFRLDRPLIGSIFLSLPCT